MSDKPREFWITDRKGRVMKAAYDNEADAKDSCFYSGDGSALHVIEYSAYLEAIEALKFECGNTCAEQNPCNAKELLKKHGVKL